MNKTNTIHLLPGPEGIKQAYEESLKSKNLDIVCLSENYSKVIGDYFDSGYSPRLNSAAHVTREILPDTPANRKDKVNKSGNHQVKLITTDGKSESDMIFTVDSVILISYNPDSPFAVIIKDQELLKSFRSQFEMMWDK